jgi:uncharacterized protein YndB with AHSA1/START domain
MKRKTEVHAEDNRQDLLITREFDLPVHKVFRAYTEPELLEQWMGNRVLKLENRAHGGYAFETRDPSGNVLFRANGVIHSLVADKSITRTFEMDGTPFPVQLEYLDFTEVTPETSRLTIHIIYKSVADRDAMLKLPFAAGINMAHNKLQNLFQS